MTRPRRLPLARLLLGLSFLAGGAALAHAADTKGFDPVAATEALLNTLPADQQAKSDAYFEGGYLIEVWNLALTLGIMGILLKSGIAVRLRNIAEKFFQVRYLQGVLFVVLFVGVNWVLTLPSEYYVGFVREHHYGLSNLTAGGWLGEHLKDLLVDAVMLSLVGSLLYQAIRRSPRRWWVYASVATPFLLVLFMVLAPVFIRPLFNKFTPLADARVRDPILSMARANGVPVDNVYQFDASKQSKRVSANVSGAFHTIRVSLNDNLLNRCSPAEVQAVMGHELGHYVLNHAYKGAIFFSLIICAGFAFAHWFLDATLRRFGPGWGLRGPDDFASLPLFLAGFSLFMALATPVSNTVIRTHEVEADIFGLNAARQPDGFATIALKLSEYRKLSPGPWEEIIFFDHPSGRNRILMAMRWKAEHLAELPPVAAVREGESAPPQIRGVNISPPAAKLTAARPAAP